MLTESWGTQVPPRAPFLAAVTHRNERQACRPAEPAFDLQRGVSVTRRNASSSRIRRKSVLQAAHYVMLHSSGGEANRVGDGEARARAVCDDDETVEAEEVPAPIRLRVEA